VSGCHHLVVGGLLGWVVGGLIGWVVGGLLVWVVVVGLVVFWFDLLFEVGVSDFGVAEVVSVAESGCYPLLEFLVASVLKLSFLKLCLFFLVRTGLIQNLVYQLGW